MRRSVWLAAAAHLGAGVGFAAFEEPSKAKTRLTIENIEDWDFRVPGADPEADAFYADNRALVERVAVMRRRWIVAYLEDELLRWWNGSNLIVPEDYEHVLERTTRPSLRDRLGRGRRRLDARVRRSLWLEWAKYGRIKLSLFPPGHM
jgi:hypothetical protein